VADPAPRVDQNGPRFGEPSTPWTSNFLSLAYNRPMTSLNEERAWFLLVVAGRIVPEVAALDERGRAQLLAIIDRALADRGPEVCRKFAVFLGVLRLAPVLRYGATFSRLRPHRQDAVLRWFESAPFGLLRQGTWGLKSMVFMGYYGRAEAWEEIGYAPSFDSLERLRA